MSWQGEWHAWLFGAVAANIGDVVLGRAVHHLNHKSGPPSSLSQQKISTVPTACSAGAPCPLPRAPTTCCILTCFCCRTSESRCTSQTSRWCWRMGAARRRRNTQSCSGAGQRRRGGWRVRKWADGGCGGRQMQHVLSGVMRADGGCVGGWVGEGRAQGVVQGMVLQASRQFGVGQQREAQQVVIMTRAAHPPALPPQGQAGEGGLDGAQDGQHGPNPRGQHAQEC